mgnify:CR=1 FL=1
MRKLSMLCALVVLPQVAVVTGCGVAPGDEAELRAMKLPTVAPTAIANLAPAADPAPKYFGEALLSAEPLAAPSLKEQTAALTPAGEPTTNYDVGTAFLSCFKDGVVDCGGAHNGGNCITFRYWNASTNPAWRFMGCDSTMGAACAALNIGGVLACGLF